ncbi:MAG: electron transfer flavoprotein subunit beta/FixA family protein [SAR324 cluster bacterium]|nr:electron transfer flavoprotein subunit beta/FixA family protein [SAR324 cluster bacterium]MCZ6533052.1 electron transfer flavoprotein subunit beta/FixA family protein [SAR324 cluster bacterium]MCZ6627316.1 electron transfer flavoprotein subunit beta/FixA family protein [SAR324 cluster bacterium]MCZ6645549.1 electron transfer flavoprotein subunit beta/FixA family protein [SAR324 cluster bacterium]MCZ6729129.1 electron transfer flavoprotein subunit beta/FixA family protein [SAR324 cluster bact
MNILVPVKSVIDVDLNIRVKDGAVVEEGMNYVLNRWDETAVEAALQLKEADEGEVTVISVGPDKAGEALRKSLAMGADRAIHVNDPAAVGSDSFGFARILAKAAQRGSYDLIITGKQSQDTDMGGTGAIMAELLGLPAVINVIDVKVGEGGKLNVHRLADAGREVLELTLPALITSNDSLNEPRLASLRGIMAAKKKPMEVLTLADLGVDADQVGAAGSRIEVLEFMSPPERAAGQKFEGDEEETTRTVMDKLVNEAKIFA